MNKATSVHSFTYLGLVVSEKNVPKNWLIQHYGDMAYNLPLNIYRVADILIVTIYSLSFNSYKTLLSMLQEGWRISRSWKIW